MVQSEYVIDDASTDTEPSSSHTSSRYVSTSSPPSPQRLFSPGASKHDSSIELSSLLSSTDRHDIDLSDEPSFHSYSKHHDDTVTPSQPLTPAPLNSKRIEGAHRVYAEFTRKHIKSRSNNVDYSEEVEPQPLAARSAPHIVRFIESLHPKAHYGHFVICITPIMNVMACQGTTFGVGFYSSHLIDELQITRSGISLCWAIALFITALIIPFAGRAFDTIGARRTAIASLPVYCGACYLFSTVDNVYTMTLSWVLLRLLCTIWQLYSSYLVNQWFVKHRVVAMTVFQCLSAVSLAFPVLLSFFEGLYGWRGSLRACAVMYAIVCSLLCLVAVDNPEKVGRKPDCVRHDALKPSPSKASFDVETAQPSAEQQVPTVVEEPRLTATSVVDADDVEIHWMYQDALRTPLFWTVVVASIIISMLWSSYNFHYKQMWQVQHVEGNYEHLFLIVTVTNFISMAIAGAIFGRIKNKARAMVMGSVMCFVSQIVLMTAHSYTQAIGFALAYGWMDGVYITGYLTVFAATFGRANVGTIDSVASATLTMACGLGPLAFGYDYDATGSFNIMYWTVLVVSVLSTVMLAFVKMPPPPPEHRRLKLDNADGH